MDTRKTKLSSGAKLFLALIALAVFVACGLITYLVWPDRSGPIQVATTEEPAPPTARLNKPDPTKAGVINPVPLATEEIAVTEVIGGETLSTPTAFEPAINWPPEKDDRPVLKVALPPFGSYFTAMQIEDYPGRPYRLELIPLRLTGLDGSELIPGTEAIQAQKMTSGEWDVLFNTADVLARNPGMGVWVTDVDQSAGADKTVSWPVEKWSCLRGVDLNTLPKNATGQTQPKFNFLKGCRIGVMDASAGEFQLLSFMRLTAMAPEDVELVRYPSVKEAVNAFTAGELDAVSGWTTDIDNATEAGGVTILDSSWLRNIHDILIVSHNANARKGELIQAFLADYFTALRYQQENPEEAWEKTAAFSIPGANTAEWLYVFPGTAFEDAKVWLEDQVAQATFDSNLILVENEDVLVERFVNARETWAWGGSPMGEPFDPKALIETKYLEALADRADEFRPKHGEFINPTYVPFPNTGTVPTPAQLISLPTVADFGCASVEFSAGVAGLTPGTEQYNGFLRCAASLKQLILASNTIIWVNGSAAYPVWENDQYGVEKARKRSEDFAKKRALNIQYALVAAGIPLERIVVTWQPGTPTNSDTKMQADRWVHIEIKRNDG